MAERKTALWAMGLVFFFTFLTSTAQLFYKLGADKLELSIPALIANYHLIAGLVLYAISAVLFIIAMRGGELSVLYPIVSLSYAWVSLLSIFFLHEQMNAWKWAGVCAIIIGVSYIGIGSE